MSEPHDDQPPRYEHHSAPGDDANSSFGTARFLLRGVPWIDADLPPAYSPPNVPAYEEEATTSRQIARYVFRQHTRRLQTVLPEGVPHTQCQQHHTNPSYLLCARRLFSRRADIALWRLFEPAPDPVVPKALARRVNAEVVAGLGYTNNTSLPWMPRGTVVRGLSKEDAARAESYAMAAPNFVDFNMAIESRALTWTLAHRPSTSLLLLERTSDPPNRVVARFSYSRYGTDASKGQAVGTLDVFDLQTREDEALGQGPDGVRETELRMLEVIIGGCEIVLQYWKRMGRHFRNDERPDRCSIFSLGIGSLGEGGLGSDESEGLGHYGIANL
jgi:hypothetical protein